MQIKAALSVSIIIYYLHIYIYITEANEHSETFLKEFLVYLKMKTVGRPKKKHN